MEPFIEETSIKREKKRLANDVKQEEASSEEVSPVKKSKRNEIDMRNKMNVNIENEAPEEEDRDSPQDDFSDQDLLSDFVEKVKARKVSRLKQFSTNRNQGFSPSEQQAVEKSLFTNMKSVQDRITDQFKPSEGNRAFNPGRTSEPRSWKPTKNKPAIPKYDDAVKLTEKLKSIISNKDESSDYINSLYPNPQISHFANIDECRFCLTNGPSLPWLVGF